MNEQNNKMEKIKRSSNIAMRIVTISKIFMIAVAVITFVSGIVLFVLSMDSNESDKFRQIAEMEQLTIDIRIFGFDIATDLADDAADLNGLAVLGAFMFFLCVLFILFAVTLHFVAKTFKEIRDSDSPFRPAVLKNLRLPLILITLMASQNSLIFGAVVGIALWCVYCIVDYGCELQRLSDETL